MKASPLVLVLGLLSVAACGGGAPEGAAPAEPRAAEPTAAAAARPQTAAAFWRSFREAALAGDARALEAHVRFPLEARGQLDGDEPRRIDAQELATRLPQLLEADTGLAEEPLTMRTLIARTTDGEFEALAREGFVRLGTFEFQQDGPAWKLVRVYLEE